MKLKWILAIGIVAALFISACEQTGNDMEELSELEELNENVTIAEEIVAGTKAAEATSSDISTARFAGHLFKGNMTQGGSHLLYAKGFPSCATVTVDSDVFPKTITIDYGDGCEGRMGLEKRGVITIFMSDTITKEGAYYTVTFEDLTLGNRLISLTATFTNEGLNEDDHWVISFESLSTTTFEKKDEVFTIVREFSGEREWLEGFDTPKASDDIFLLSSNGSITVNDELKFEKTTIEPLLIDRTCRWPLSGILEITKGGESMTIDYGEGDCDNIAEVTKDGETEEIELNSCKFKDGFEREDKNMNKNKGWW